MNVVAFVPLASVRAPVAFWRLFQSGVIVELGISATTRDRNPGVAAPPDVGPANTTFALWFDGDGSVSVPAADAVTSEAE